jgi:sorbitol-specific phosphotransferase system component IIC
MWSENGLIVFRMLVKKSVSRFILGRNFLNKTSNLNFVLGTCMRNRAKPLFYSVLFNKCHHRTNLIALLFSDFLFKR